MIPHVLCSVQKGIGAATAILFARAGSNLIITARREAKLQEVKHAAEEANKQGGTGKGGKVLCLPLDMQDKHAVDSFLSNVPEDFKKIDVLGGLDLFWCSSFSIVGSELANRWIEICFLGVIVNNAGLVYGRDTVGDLNFDEVEVMISM